jgi:hypothetical protein
LLGIFFDPEDGGNILIVNNTVTISHPVALSCKTDHIKRNLMAKQYNDMTQHT